MGGGGHAAPGAGAPIPGLVLAAGTAAVARAPAVGTGGGAAAPRCPAAPPPAKAGAGPRAGAGPGASPPPGVLPGQGALPATGHAPPLQAHPLSARQRAPAALHRLTTRAGLTSNTHKVLTHVAKELRRVAPALA